MPDLTETLRLADLVCARLCHDLGGVIGTLDGAVGLLAEAPSADPEVAAFARSASAILVHRLRLARAAWGGWAAAPANLAELRALAVPPLAARRIALDTGPLPEDAAFPPDAARLTLNLLLLAAESLPKGGGIAMTGTLADLFVRIDGPDAAWPAGLAACVNDPNAAIAALTAPRSVQMPLLALMALAAGARLSPVLVPAGGIAAMRLTVGG